VPTSCAMAVISSQHENALDGVTGRPQDLAVKVAVPQSDGVFNRRQAGPAPSIVDGTTMGYYAGIDVSLESSSLCTVDATGRIVREAKISSEPEAVTTWLRGLGERGGCEITRTGLEAGPLSQWLYAGMKQAGLPVELLETRHVGTAFKIMPVKTDRKDARGIAQLMRLGWFRPVHCKSLAAQETRALLGARKLLQIKLHDIELSLRGALRGFGLKVGKTTPKTFEGRVRSLVGTIRRCWRLPTRCCGHARCWLSNSTNWTTRSTGWPAPTNGHGC
jgi:hypothetical protein